MFIKTELLQDALVRVAVELFQAQNGHAAKSSFNGLKDADSIIRKALGLAREDLIERKLKEAETHVGNCATEIMKDMKVKL